MLELGLFEVQEEGGPRLLGRLSDEDLIRAARERLAAAQRRELARLGGHLSPVEGEGDEGAS